MGYPMAGHLKNKGSHDVTVYNRNAAKADKWVTQYGGKKASAVAAQAKTKPAATSKPAQPASRPKPKPEPAATRKPARLANPERLPLAVARALARNAVVVVSLYDPEAKVDRISLAEARAGARRANVGFVALNVLDPRASEALIRKLGVLSAPAFFLYRRPGELVMRVDGFADRDLVAQAAVTALPPGAPRNVAPRPAVIRLRTWAREANAVCAKSVATSPRIPFDASAEQLTAAGPQILAAEKREAAALRALTLPTVPADRARARQLVALFGRYYASERALFEAFTKGRKNAIARLLPSYAALVERGNGLARSVGAPACAHFGR
jgi:hypothetical protein